MKVAVVGSRSFNDYELLKSKLDALNEKVNITHIVSGGAKGADSLAEKWAKDNKIETVVFYPDWEKYGKSAGFLRNELIIKEADIVIVFWDGSSKGTKLSIDLAIKYSKPHKIIYFNSLKSG